MAYPIFLSVILAVRNEGDALEPLLRALSATLSGLAEDHELIVIDNASSDGSVSALQSLTGPEGLPNLQIFALAGEVDHDTAIAAGLDNALGDFVAVLDPASDDASFLQQMLEAATNGHDIVFAANEETLPQSFGYRLFAWGFDLLYRGFARTRLTREAPLFRVLSRRVVNFLLQHPQAAIAYRALSGTGGFRRTRLAYRAKPMRLRPKRLADSIDRGIRLLVSTTRGPMRLVTLLCLFGAFANLAYCGYVIGVALLVKNVAPGWVTLSLQQSGMFFLISLVLLVLGEYILQMARISNQGPAYTIAQEFTSAVTASSRRRLNIEDVRDGVGARPAAM